MPKKKSKHKINVTKPNFSKNKKSERIPERIRTYNITMASASQTDKWGINLLLLIIMIKYSCIQTRAIHGTLHRTCNV